MRRLHEESRASRHTESGNRHSDSYAESVAGSRTHPHRRRPEPRQGPRNAHRPTPFPDTGTAEEAIRPRAQGATLEELARSYNVKPRHHFTAHSMTEQAARRQHRQRPPPPRCIFCGQGGVAGHSMSGEHLWPCWMHPYLPNLSNPKKDERYRAVRFITRTGTSSATIRQGMYSRGGLELSVKDVTTPG